MENQNKLNARIGPSFATSVVNPDPTPFAQYLSEVPTGAKGNVRSAEIKLTNRSLRKALKRRAVIAQFFLNVPLVDGLTTVNKYYSLIRKIATNYDRTNQDSFFDQYPDLIILSSLEISGDDTHEPVDLSVDWLRRHRDQLCERLAHFYYHYGEAVKLYKASIVNILTMNKLDGCEPFKDFASAFRWARVNSNTNMVSRFPDPVGFMNDMLDKTKWAYGDSTFGAEVVAFPLWTTDIFGNRGFHAQDLPSLFSQNDDATFASENISATNSKQESKAAFGDLSSTSAGQLLYHMTLTMEQFAWNDSAPSVPRIENGGTIWYSTVNTGTPGNTNSRQFKMNLDSNSGGMNKTPNGASTDQIIDRIWNCYRQWERYLIVNFPEMTDTENDLYTFAVNELKLFEASITAEDMLAALRNNRAMYVLSDLANHMVYKSKNQVTTATVVRYTPLLVDPSKSDNQFESRAAFSEDSAALFNAFKSNFERYDVKNPVVGDMLSEAKKWPSITPTTFTQGFTSVDLSGDFVIPPLVINSVPTTGPAVQAEPGARPITGKNAVYFDNVCTVNNATDSSFIDTVGVTSDFALDFVTQNNGCVIQEDPSQVRTGVVPLIDNTDIYQCGFSILMSSDDLLGNEFTTHYSDINNYAEWSSKVYAISSDDKVATDLTTFSTKQDGDGDYYRAHVACSEYMDWIGHTLIFVGAAIFSHPWLRFANSANGSPYGYLLRSTYDPSKTINVNSKKTVTTAIKSIDDSIDDDGSRVSNVDWNYDIFRQWYGASDFSAKTPSPAPGVAGAINRLQTECGPDTYRVYLFDPSYGPVLPIVMENPAGNLLAWNIAISQDDSMFNVGTMGKVRQDSLVAVKPVISKPVPTYVDVDTYVNRSPSITSDSCADKEYLYFIQSFSYKPSYVNDVYIPRVVEKKDFTINVLPYSYWPLTLLARARIMFPGVEDTHAYRELVESLNFKQANCPAVTKFSIPQENVMAKPKLNPREQRGYKSLNNYAGNSRSPSPEKDTVESNSTGDRGERERDTGNRSTCNQDKPQRDRKYRDKNKRKNKSGKNLKGSNSEMNPDDRKGGYSTAPDTSNVTSEGSDVDMSSKASDKRVKELIEKSVDTRSLSQSS